MPRLFEDCQHTIEIKKSRFITYLHRTEDEDDAKAFIKFIRKKHPGATHYVTAMVIGPLVRSNDDGEPSQTAGHPMLDVLLHAHMENVLAVVVRYFGGTKLGTGGLVRAYRQSVQDALQIAVLSEITTYKKYRITFSYQCIGKIDSYLRNHTLEILDTRYTEQVVYEILTTTDISNDLNEVTNGTISIQYIEDVNLERSK